MKLNKDDVLDARKTVDDAIDALNAVPKTFGGHREADSTSVIDAVRFARDARYRLTLFGLGYLLPEAE